MASIQRTVLDNGKVCVPLGPSDPMPATGFVWLDLVYDKIDELAPEVERLVGVRIFEDHLLDAKNLGHPSFFDNTDDYEMIIFRGLAPSTSDERIETRPMVILSFDRLLATVRAPDSRSVEQVRSRFLGQPGRVPRDPDELVHRLLSAQVDHYLDLRQSLTRRVERWQAELLDPRKPYNNWRQLLLARTEIRKLEDLCEEQHDAIQEWRDYRFQDISAELQVRITDLIEHIARVLTHVRRIEATVESAVQLHFSAVTHRTSEIMRVLTLITAIFMPLTLITGIFGMNFEMIPGLHSQWGFWASIALMGGVVCVLLFLFRRKKWM
jgi:magnesium transporter